MDGEPGARLTREKVALTATLGILGAYILVALSGILFFRRAKAENVAYNVLLTASQRALRVIDGGPPNN